MALSWNRKRDKYDDETDGDFEDCRSPRLIGTIQEVEFIKRDDTNSEVMDKLKIKW